jgi:DNA-binding MarR family transcriptional regulator
VAEATAGSLRPRFPDQPDFLPRLVRELAAQLNAELSEGIAREVADVTPAQNRLLTYIDADGTSVSELARRADMTKQSMHEAVVGLERRGLVVRRADPVDRRVKLVVLTDEGWAAIRLGLEVVLGIHDRWQRLLGDRKADQLLRLLRELLDALDGQ